MSTPHENPGPEQPGSQPPDGGYGSQPGTNAPQPPPPGYQAPPPGYQAPPPGYQAPPPGYQPPPPGYQAPPPGYQAPAPGYQQQPPPYQQPGGSDFKFEMPADMPHSMNDVMPKGGLSGIFSTTGLPTLLKVSYILWLVTAGFWLLGTIIGFLISLVTLSGKGIILSIISLAVIAAIVVCAMKLKEGLQWPRMALTVLAVVSLILVFAGAGGVGVIGIVATILMWLPESTAWINSRKGWTG
ncbi:hypothetical protein ACQCSX_11830 [Pseudarthrobacter sp. P1]|uniref:hypothetical protein n=1 Tax=Pseudarthrobacter sp. P1 TaxID=3418418 RepID=UPI003CFB1BC3